MKISIQKQCEIWDTIQQGYYSIRQIAIIHHISKTTAENYKKNGPPFLCKLLKNNHIDPNLLTWLDQRKLFIQQIEDLQQMNTQLTNHKNEDDNKIQNLTQEQNEKDKKFENLAQQNEGYKEEIQRKNTILEDVQQKLKDAWPKIEHIFSEMSKEVEKWKTKYYASQEENKSLQKVDENHKDTLVPPKDTQTTESTPAIDEETDDSSITIEWPMLAAVGTTVIGISALLYLAWKNRPAQLPPSKTLKRGIPLEWYDGYGPRAKHTDPTSEIRNINTTNHEQGGPEQFQNPENTTSLPDCTSLAETHSYQGERIQTTNDITPDEMDYSHAMSMSPLHTPPTCISGSPLLGMYGQQGIPNMTDEMLPTTDYTFGNRGVSFTYISGLQHDEPPDNTSFGTTFIPQEMPPVYSPPQMPAYNPSHYTPYYPPVYTPPPPKIYTYTLPQYAPYYPLPNELLIPYTNLWIPIFAMNWYQWVIFIGWVFQRLGYVVQLLKLSYDDGGDILCLGYGQRIIIQVKHRKKNTGTTALMEVFWAKKRYQATKAMVISYSDFTKRAINEASEEGIELLDLGQFLIELRKRGIDYPLT